MIKGGKIRENKLYKTKFIYYDLENNSKRKLGY